MFEDQYVELLPARTTMQTVNVTGAGGFGGPPARVALPWHSRS